MPSVLFPCAAGLPPPFAQVVEAADNINVHEKKIIRNKEYFILDTFC